MWTLRVLRGSADGRCARGTVPGALDLDLPTYDALLYGTEGEMLEPPMNVTTHPLPVLN